MIDLQQSEQTAAGLPDEHARPTKLWTGYRLFLAGAWTASFIVMAVAYGQLLVFLDSREGLVTMHDPVLLWLRNVVPRRDMSLPIGLLLYSLLGATVCVSVRTPRQWLLLMHCSMLFLVVRSVLLYVTPLQSPEGIIPLSDPLASLFTRTRPLENDLFFSGHSAVAFMCACLLNERAWHRALAVSLWAVLVLMMLQQGIHYTADCLVAPFIMITLYQFALQISDLCI